MGAGPGVRRVHRSTGRVFAGLVFVAVLAGCGSSAASPSVRPSKTVPPSATPSAAPSATPSLAPSPTSAPHFVPTGSLQVARLYATATLLTNGKVLIAGGMPCQPSGGLASAELYDPKTGTFTMTGALTIPRGWAVATLLQDGRVLVVAGDDPGTGGCTTPYQAPSPISGSSSDIYDPTTGRFTRVGSVIASVPDTAIVLPDGSVLTAESDNAVLETYDPATGKFSRPGSLLRSYEHLGEALLPDGKVLFVGSTQVGGPRAEIYDPASGKSRSLTLQLPASATVAPRDYDLTAPPTTLKDGRVLLCIFDYLEIYDPSNGSFTAAGSISPPELWFAADRKSVV